MNHKYLLQSEELLLTPMTAQDSEKYRMLRNRDDNKNFFFSSRSISLEQQIIWYRNYLEDDKQYMFSVYEANSMLFIGGIGLYNIDYQKGNAELGRILIDRNVASGKHYGAKAIRL